MNVIVANRYKDALADLDIEVIKKIEGEFTAEEIINTFKNFFFQRMILDITALKDYKDIKTLQQLSLSLDMDRVILLLDDSKEVTDPEFLSDLISMHIYNFTMNVEGIKYLYTNPNSYRDVAQYHQLDTTHEIVTNGAVVSVGASNNFEDGKVKIIGFKNVTEGAGATSLIYMIKNQLSRNYNVVAVEVDKRDFMYFGDSSLVSTTSQMLGNVVSSNSMADVILIDMNKSDVAKNLVNEVIYLVEPSKIKLNKLLSTNSRAFVDCRGKKLVLNKSLLSNHDLLDFEYETSSKVFYSIPPLYDQEVSNAALDAFLIKLGFLRQTSEDVEKKKGIFGLFNG